MRISEDEGPFETEEIIRRDVDLYTRRCLALLCAEGTCFRPHWRLLASAEDRVRYEVLPVDHESASWVVHPTFEAKQAIENRPVASQRGPIGGTPAATSRLTGRKPRERSCDRLLPYSRPLSASVRTRRSKEKAEEQGRSLGQSPPNEQPLSNAPRRPISRVKTIAETSK